MTLTKKQVQKYCENDTLCPYCDSDQVEGDGQVLTESGHAYQDVQCKGCEKTWTDEYTLTGIVETQS